MAADFSLWNISVFYYRFRLQALWLLWKVSGAFGVCGQLEPELVYPRAGWQSMERVFNILLDGTGFGTDWEVCEGHHAGDITIH